MLRSLITIVVKTLIYNAYVVCKYAYACNALCNTLTARCPT